MLGTKFLRMSPFILHTFRGNEMEYYIDIVANLFLSISCEACTAYFLQAPRIIFRCIFKWRNLFHCTGSLSII